MAKRARETASVMDFAEEGRERKSKSWCFTLNNYTEAQEQMFKDQEKLYLIMGREKAETGTRHLQGCITYANSKRFAAVTKYCKEAHWGAAKELEGARNYCMKELDYYLEDNRKPKGKRTDLEAVCAESSLDDVIAKYPEVFIKYHGGLGKLFSHRMLSRDLRDVTVKWFWGPTGTGKTRTAFEETSGDICSISLSGDRAFPFFNGYSGEKAVLIDDLRPNYIQFSTLLRVLDIYPMVVNTKGGFTPWRATTVYITAPYAPDELFRGQTDEAIGQLLRRITEVREFTTQQES